VDRNDGKMNRNGRRYVFCIKAPSERGQGRGEGPLLYAGEFAVRD